MPSPIPTDSEDLNLIRRNLHTDVPELRAALEHMRGSMVLHIIDEGQPIWIYKHPTVFDAYAEIVASTPEAVELFLRGAKPDEICSQVVCGLSQPEASVHVPRTPYPLLVDRLSALQNEHMHNARLFNFMAERADKEFLELLLAAMPNVLDRKTWSFSGDSNSPALRLIKRLDALGLATVDHRSKGAQMLSNPLLNGGDARFLYDSAAMKLFEPTELLRLGFAIRETLMPRLDEIIDDVERELLPSETADESFDELRRSLDALNYVFDRKTELIRSVKRFGELPISLKSIIRISKSLSLTPRSRQRRPPQ